MHAKRLIVLLVLTSLRWLPAAQEAPGLRLTPAQVEVRLQAAREARERSELAEARRILDRLAVLAPDHVGVRHEREILDRLAGALPVADARLKEAEGIRDDLAKVEVRVALKRAEIYLANADHRRALAAVGQAQIILNRHPQDGQAELMQRIVELAHRAK